MVAFQGVNALGAAVGWGGGTPHPIAGPACRTWLATVRQAMAHSLAAGPGPPEGPPA